MILSEKIPAIAGLLVVEFGGYWSVRWSERDVVPLPFVAACCLEVIWHAGFVLLAISGLLQFDAGMTIRFNAVEYVQPRLQRLSLAFKQSAVHVPAPIGS